MDLCKQIDSHGRAAISWPFRWIVTCSLLIVLVLSGPALVPAIAQDTTVPFDIPAQPLSAALDTFAEQAHVQMLYKMETVSGLQSASVSGQLTPAQALQNLLQGTGLSFQSGGPNTITIVNPVVGPNSEADPISQDRSQAQKPVKVPEVLVKDVKQRETADLNNLPPEYAGGQVASGGRVGILGNRNIMDTPFTQMNYTSKLIQDQQARFLGDVLRNDPSVQLAQPTSAGYLTFSIRGFPLNENDMLFNGLAIGTTVQGTMMTEGIERVEVLRGPNALLNGGAPGGSIGGMVNLVSKRAGEEALTQLTAQYMSNTQVGGHADISRRFGSHKQFGIRINGVYRNGDLPINHSSRESALTTVGLDYRGDIVRLSVDFGYQEVELRGARRQFVVNSSVIALPEPPDTQTNAYPSWDLNKSRALYGTLRGEIDVTKQITAFADFGINKDRRQAIFQNRRIGDSQGTLPAINNTLRTNDNQTIMFNAGLRGAFDTGPIHHRAVVAYTQYSAELQRSPLASFAMPASNIYNPVFTSAPPSSLLPGYSSTTRINETDLSSVAVGDTLSILDERVQLTGGVRFQQIKVTNFNQATGVVTSEYDKGATTPMVGLVVKPWQRVSLYGNYIEGLQQGPTAPLGAANEGQVFAPFRSKGYEAGVKVDVGRFAATLAAFQLTQPNAFINPDTNVFGVDGEQRNRGLEFSAFGEVMEGLRLLGGASYIDSKLTKTAGGVNQGNRGAIAPFQFTLYGEWDLPFLKALTLTSRVTHASSQYVNLENTQKVREWIQWDLGTRYWFVGPHGKPITLRAFVNNVLDDNAWYGSAQFGQIIVRDPRTLMLSATFDF